jgi:hypothetical protein
MLRSNINNDNSDFKFVKEPDHVEKVWATIEKNIPVYFQKIIEGGDELAALKSNAAFKVKVAAPDVRKKLSEIFVSGIEKYEKLAAKYRAFFDEESLQEFEDENNPKQFKTKLSIEIPLIRKALQSKYEAMKEWQEKFAWAKAQEVYSIFINLIGFMNNYIDNHDAADFGNYDDLTELNDLFQLNEDDDYNVPGVIGMGIKSSVLHFLNQSYFLGANKNTLYGYYFLSDCEHFRLPSRTNEFVMTNDLKEKNYRGSQSNNLIDQNYWYPYDLFTLYSLRTYRLLKKLCADYKYHLNDEQRFVYVNTFMAQIWDMKIEVINTMTGGDQDETR